MDDLHAAVEKNAGSYTRKSGSNSRNAVDGITPSVIGTVTFLPVLSSMIVMVSATGIPFTDEKVA
jgi:hypothetical protein